MIGRTISHYRIVEQLGEGGMGVVYRARDTRLERDVALKFIRPDLVRAESDRNRFLREARVLASLDHPNICTLYEIDEADGQLFMAMAFIDGKSLRDLKESGPIEVSRAREIVRQVAEGLHAAHERGIVHRDVKSSNVILTPGGRAKILDFGLARRSDTSTLTREGTVVGTLAYMSPEQATGDAVDRRTDIWALGVLLYELTTGELPFHADYDQALVYLIVNQAPRAMRDHRPDVPDELQALVDRALAKEPAARFATASEFIAAIDACAQTGAAGGAAPAPSASVRGAPVASTAPANSLGVLDFSNITRNADDDWLAGGIAESITVDFKRIASLAVAARDHVARMSVPIRGDLATADVCAVGGRIGVSWVVWGGYQHAGDSIRITAHVSDVRTGAVVRSIKVDGAMGDIFKLQDEIVLGLADAMQVTVSVGERDRIEREETHAPRAYELAARARLLFSSGSVRHFDEARELYRRALEIDSSYALGHSGLGSLHMWRYIASENPDDLKEGIRHLEKAIALDPELGDAHVWLTYFRLREGNVDAAIETGRRAVALEDINFQAHYFLGLALVFRSQLEYHGESVRAGARELRRATELAPDHQASLLVLGWLYLFHGQYDEAETLFDRALEAERNPASTHLRFVGAHAMHATLRMRRGDLDGAEREYRDALTALAASTHAYVPTFVALTHCGLGEIALARGRGDDATVNFQRALDAVETSPRTLGIGHVAVRAHCGLARTLYSLGMMRDMQAHATRARNLLAGGEEYSFAWTVDCCTAQSCYDVAIACLALRDSTGALAHLGDAVRRGWRETPRLLRDRWPEHFRTDAAYEELAEKVRMSEPLP